VDWTANVVSLSLVLCATGALAFALLWRVSTWQISNADLLNTAEGIRVGDPAPEVAAYAGSQEFHLSFGQRPTLLVFGTSGCEPCDQLLETAAMHPATRGTRLVAVSDKDELDIRPDLIDRWENYRFADEQRARRMWRAPVSPYFHFIDQFGRVAAKGVANRPEHLDRLLQLPPASVRVTTLNDLAEPDVVEERA
jgi:hypothetical protein